jgi:ABC-type transporter Mla subunit MlaD
MVKNKRPQIILYILFGLVLVTLIVFVGWAIYVPSNKDEDYTNSSIMDPPLS